MSGWISTKAVKRRKSREGTKWQDRQIWEDWGRRGGEGEGREGKG